MTIPPMKPSLRFLALAAALAVAFVSSSHAAVAIGQAFAGTLLVLQPEPPPTFTVCSALPKLS